MGFFDRMYCWHLISLVQKDSEDTETLKEKQMEDKAKMVSLFLAQLMSPQWPQTRTHSWSTSAIHAFSSHTPPLSSLPYKSCPARSHTLLSCRANTPCGCVCLCQVESTMIQPERKERGEIPPVPARPTQEVRKQLPPTDMRLDSKFCSVWGFCF